MNPKILSMGSKAALYREEPTYGVAYAPSGQNSQRTNENINIQDLSKKVEPRHHTTISLS
jgi:hypothetical protein